MPALLLSLLPLLGRVAPELIGLALGGRAQGVASRIETAVQDVFGTTDAAQVQAAADADPSKVDALKARLDAETDRAKAELADVQDARATQAKLVQLHSRLQWVPAAISLVIVLGYFVTLYGVLYMVFTNPAELTVNQVAILSGLIGVLTAAFVQVCNYWLGTSSGAMKRGDQAIAAAYDAAPGGRS